MEVLEVILVSPELLGVLVQVINPKRGSRPTVSNEVINTIRLFNINIGQIRGNLTALIFNETLAVDRIALVVTYVAILD